jgi:uncharacterized membrane protein YhaH (DUF805 family)
VNPGFGVVGVPGQEAFGQQPNRGTAADAFAALTTSPQYGYAPQMQYGPGAIGDHRFVGPLRAIGLGFGKYVRFTGRSSRSEFWWWILFWYLVLFAFSVGLALLIVNPARVNCDTRTLANCTFNATPLWIYSAAFLIFFIGTVAPTVAIMCRRLQDAERSGNWVWLYFATIFVNLIPVVGHIISLAISILFIVWFAWPGTPGPNRFGDVPHEGR